MQLSANGESAPSNSSITVRDGCWGDAPAAIVTARSSTSAVVSLGLALVPVSYPIHTYVAMVTPLESLVMGAG